MTNRGPFDLRKDVVLEIARIDILHSLGGAIVGWYGSSNGHCHGISFR